MSFIVYISASSVDIDPDDPGTYAFTADVSTDTPTHTTNLPGGSTWYAKVVAYIDGTIVAVSDQVSAFVVGIGG